ncbi:MAG: DUF4332 domain-containing protein [Cyanobacteria bacterium SID2]|nr:DUF4332 domain-containing protein [Cyanobacteria bacterium SID2]MBP0005717.1 DUF4332 domain-containing protein [Cyanobacteria bacterium SBC]
MSLSSDSSLQTPGNWSIDRLPGLNAEDCQKLKDRNIYTTYDLLDRAGRRDLAQSLAAEMQIAPHYVKKWVALADLARVPSVGCQYCGLLLHCGILSTAQLSQTPIHKLYPQLLRLHVSTLRRKDLCPPRGEVLEWIRSAQLVTKRL